MRTCRSRTTFLIAAMTSLVGLIAPAQAASRDDKLLQLVEVTQVTASAQLSIDRQVANDKAQVQQALQQLIDRARPAPPYVAQLQEAADVFAADLKAPIEARDIAAVWAQSFAKDFSDDELDQLLAFYASPLGQRAIRAGQVPSGAMAEFVQASQLMRSGKANEKLQRRLAEIARDCNCAPR